MAYLIRNSVKNDIYDIIHVVTISWNETYKGIVPDSELEKLKTNEEERAQKLLQQYENGEFQEYVLEIDNKIVGFIRFGKSEDSEFTACGEIYAFYIINQYHGLGLGRKLFELAVRELKKQGFNKMIIACLKDNPTNNFYIHMGGKYLKDGIYQRLNLKENIYYYDI